MARKFRRPHPHIPVNGDTAVPRRELAEVDLGVSDKTASRMKLHTFYLGGVAYVLRNQSLEIIAGGVKHRNQLRRGR